MKLPHEDPTWPTCAPHHEKHWCSTSREILVEGKDGQSLESGTRALVPVVPQNDIYAQVALDSEVISGIMVKLYLVKTKIIFDIEEELIPLGLHTLGEGRLIIAQTIAAWMEGFEPEKCTYHAHSFPQEQSLKAFLRDNEEVSIKSNRACLTLYDKCFPCYLSEKAKQVTPLGDFGLGDVSEPRNRNSNVLNTLKNRFQV